ncbi:MAG TPA: hypothetical protein VFT22_18925 [Kofleriaceae bacterium]|nr:hypothetical protein [Kofleriaceae bacterium]
MDPPVQLDAKFRYDINDRAYLDGQIRAVEQHLVDLVIGGTTGTWFFLDSGSAAVVAGDCVCSAAINSSPRNVTKAVAAALASAGCVLGVVLVAASPGSFVKVATGGTLPSTLTGLGAASAGPVRVNTTTARCQAVSPLGSADYPVGTQDAQGNLRFLSVAVGAAGGNLSGPLQWDASATPSILQAPNTTDVACHDFTLTSQAPFSGATGTNRNSGNLVYVVPAPAAGGVAGKHSFKVAGTEYLAITATAIQTNSNSVTFGAGVFGAAIGQDANPSDVVCHDFTLSSQAPFASATGANRNPGNMVYTVPSPAGAGTAGKHSFKISGTEIVAITTSAITTTGTEIVLEQTGDTSGTTRVHVQSRGGVNGLLVDNPSIDLADVVLKGSAHQFAIRMESRAGNPILSGLALPEFQFGTAGSPTVVVNSTTVGVGFLTPLVQWTPSVVAPKLFQIDQGAASTNGQPLTIQAQNATGTTSTGGDLNLTSGTGTTASGSTRLQHGGTTKIQVNATGIGFFGVTPAARQTYTTSNHTDSRTLNETAATLVQVANVVGTIIKDMQALGLIA